MKYLGIGCLAILILVIAGGSWAWIQREALVRWAVSKGVSYAAESQLRELGFPDDERAALMESVRMLADRIQTENLGEEDIELLLHDREIGPALGVVLVRGFWHKYIPQAGYNDAEQATAAITISRFQDAILRHQVADPVFERLAEQVFEDQDNPTPKPTLSRPEIDACLAIMKDAADDAGIPETLIHIDAAAELHRAASTYGTEPTPEPPVEIPDSL